MSTILTPISVATWKALQREARSKGKAPMKGGIVRAGFTAVVATAGGDSRSLDFTISTGSVDRDGDTINPEGWKLASFRKNPVVLWAHDHQSLPVGKAENVRIEDGKLKSRVVFTPAGLTRFNDTVFEMLKGGFLSATSVGFIPLKWTFVDDATRGFGVDFLEQELLEFSIVNVPANDEALMDPKPSPKLFPHRARAERRLEIIRARGA